MSEIQEPSEAEILARLSDEQLRAGIVRGRREIGVIDALEQSEDFRHGAPDMASKSYEIWSGCDYERRRRAYELGIRIAKDELARRAGRAANAAKLKDK